VAVGFETGGILFSIQIRGHNEAGFGVGIADEAQHFFIADQRFGGPVFGYLGEQTMLDRVPFGRAGRVVSDCRRDAEWIAQLSLKLSLPGPGSATVAAAGVRQDQHPGSLVVAARSLTFPPGGYGMGGERRRVVRNADADRAAVIRRIVNAVGDANSAGIGAEVVIVDRHRRAIPLVAGVFEVADQSAVWDRRCI